MSALLLWSSGFAGCAAVVEVALDNAAKAAAYGIVSVVFGGCGIAWGRA